MEINQIERAYHVWNLLVETAKHSKTLTYKEATDKTGYHWRVLRYPLELIQNHCIENFLPPLTILIVNSTTGLPGEGFTACDKKTIDLNTRKVLEFKWNDYQNPFEFAKDGTGFTEILNLIEKGEISNEKVRKVNDRGIIQSLLKEAAMKNYGAKCSFCEMPFSEILEACHIKPWIDCNEDEKKDIKNIILLCRNHHKMFDAGIIELDQEYRIKLQDGFNNKSIDVKKILGRNANSRILLPLYPYYPDIKYIKYNEERRRTSAST